MTAITSRVECIEKIAQPISTVGMPIVWAKIGPIVLPPEKFEWEGKQISVTVSLGVAVRHPGENVPDPMVHRADAALYKAKEAGKNCIRTEVR